MGCKGFSSFWIDIQVLVSADRFCWHSLKRALLQKCTIENTLRNKMRSFLRGWVSVQATNPGRRKLQVQNLPSLSLSLRIQHWKISLIVPSGIWVSITHLAKRSGGAWRSRKYFQEYSLIPKNHISASKSLYHLIWCEFPQDHCTAVQSPNSHRYRSIPSGELKKLHFERSMFIPQYLWWDKFSWGPSNGELAIPLLTDVHQPFFGPCCRLSPPALEHDLAAYTTFLMSHQLLVLSSPSGIFLPLRGRLCNPS